MNAKNIKWLSLSLLAVFFWSCDPEFDDSVEDGDFFSPGEVDFSNFVSVGNSLTAGFADNALYITGQENSFPNIMARQFRLVGGGDFEIPFMADNLGGFLVNGVQAAPNRLVLAADAQTATPLGPAVLAGTPTTEILNTLQGPFNNMGVPGAKSFHLLAPGFGDPAGLSASPQTANPYFVRFASSPGTTVIADAVAQNPSFFSLWIGNNDILGFATSGGDGSNPITDLPTFQGAYTTLVNQLIATGAEGILTNIPDVTSIPFFTTVPFNALDPTNPAFGPQIPTLNQTFGLLNQVYAFLGVPERSIVFSANGPSALVIHDEALANLSQQITQVLIQAGVPAGQATIFGALYGQSRQANAGDLLTLTSASAIGTINQNNVSFLTGLGLPADQAAQLSVNGITFPLEDRFVLVPSEQMEISNAVDQYNTIIEDLAVQNNLAFLDARSLLQEVATTGIPYDGGVLTSTFATGGAFSLDGVHPTPRGYALVANEMIDAINAKYNADIPKVSVGSFPTITLSNDI